MKRQIEFKAWHIEEKKMCEVSIINLSKGAFLIGVKPGPDSFDEEDSEEEFNQTPQNGRFCYFDEFELLQFTGLPDKNGVKVFEGDQLRLPILSTLEEFKHNEILTVVFKNAAFCLVNERRSMLLSGVHIYEFEVIGNIHDNPEL